MLFNFICFIYGLLVPIMFSFIEKAIENRITFRKEYCGVIYGIIALLWPLFLLACLGIKITMKIFPKQSPKIVTNEDCSQNEINAKDQNNEYIHNSHNLEDIASNPEKTDSHNLEDIIETES
jgi:hypothetical protein